MTPMMSRFRQLALCILAGILLPIAPAQADSTRELRAPPVAKLVVTCEYIGGAVSPLQMHVEGFGMMLGNPFIVEFDNVQTGLSHTVTPARQATDGSRMGLYHFPLLQPGIYDVTVAWADWSNGVAVPDTSRAMLLSKGLKIPTIRLTGGRGTGCQV